MSLPSPSIASSDATLVAAPTSSAFGGGSIHGGGGQPDSINVQIYVPEYNLQKCIQANLDESVWEAKKKILALLPKDMQEGFNYGLFLPPCNGRAGKFLLEERPLRDYPFQDCVPYLELKYKKRVYKMLNLDEKALKQLHTKATLKKFLEYVEERQAEKVEKLCAQGLDPNFHDSTGETPLTIASSIDENKPLLLALTSGGAHLDFRNMEGQTALHKAAFLASHANIKTLLELGASPNYKDPLGLTPLYYCMLKSQTNPNTAELLLRDYSELGVTDPHGNHEVHQACKNGLVPHLEHLLFYGAEINCQNVNGNTPLHVCAVNNQEACARVLLFRGSDPNIVNNQNQTAFHMAVITGHHGVAELIRTHDAKSAVPYRGMPRYNSKRRLARRSPGDSASSSSMGMSRAKSFVGSSAASECGYGTMQRGGGSSSVLSSRSHAMRTMSESGTPASSVAPSPSILRHPINNGQHHQRQPMESQHYGVPLAMQHQQQQQIHRGLHHTQSSMPVFSGNQTMPPECRPAVLQMIKKSVSEQNAMATIRGSVENAVPPIQRIPPDMAGAISNNDVNIPRILVIPRGPKGYGFILRGAKKIDATVNFEPTPEIPALQYFEGVDMNGMAMKAGLKPGDFLLEINGNDVRCASHDQVVRLIQISGETISLKVITIDPNEPMPAAQFYGTMRRNSKAAPPPPLRHPATSLSIAAGRAMAGLARYDDYQLGATMAVHGHQHHHHAHNRSAMYPNATMSVAKSIEHIPVAYRDPRDKVASVRGRVNSRRISAAELEQLMARQNATGQPMIPSTTSFGELESPGTPGSVRSAIVGGPKVYNSVAEMKRQRLQRNQQQHQQQMPHHQQQRGSIILIDASPSHPSSSSSGSNGSATITQATSLKSFHSSPDLQASELTLARDYADDEQEYDDDAEDGNNNGTLRRRMPSMDNERYYASNDKGGYGVPGKSLRPKTPPPAPPVNAPGGSRLGVVRSAPPPPQPGRPAPAPPPPPTSNQSYDDRSSMTYLQGGVYRSEQPHIPEPDYDDPPMDEMLPPARMMSHVSAAPPPPPLPAGPLPPISTSAPPPPPPPPPPPVPQSGGNDLASALAMRRQQIMNKQSSQSDEQGQGGDQQQQQVPTKNPDGGKANFNNDLKNAIARRRTQMDKQQTTNGSSEVGKVNNNSTNSNDKVAADVTKTTTTTRVVGMSLKESVQSNIQTGGRKTTNNATSTNTVVKNGKAGTGQGGNSPPIPNGFAQKKDSGFSSSRNSLEPSECEETASTSSGSQNGGDGQDTVLIGNEDTLKQHRVSFLSHQLEDSIGSPQIRGRPPMQAMKPSASSSLGQPQLTHSIVIKQGSNSDQQDAISLTSTLSTLSGCSDATGSSAMSQQQHQRLRQTDSSHSRDAIPPMPQGPPPLPPPDYDAADSGTGDSENDDVTPTLSQQNLAHQVNSFRAKPLLSWSIADVCDWLDSLYLSEYKRGFSRSNVDGRRLGTCDRTQFTQLGVTRIAHRIAMENSLKQFKSDNAGGNSTTRVTFS